MSPRIGTTEYRPRGERKILSHAYTQEWIACVRKLGGDPCGLARVAQGMKRSTAIVHGAITPSAVVPRLFDATTQRIMAYAATTMHGIVKKVILRYLQEPAYRSLFHFDPRLEELALSPCGHSELVPFARYDIFLDESSGDFVFCELNADGSSGMNEDREVTRTLQELGAYRLFAQNHSLEGNELFSSWSKSFMRIYRSSSHATENPIVAICDYRESATMSELEAYRKEFEKNGIECIICDVRELKLLDGRLRTPEGRAIDAVWRRCVTNDVLRHWNESRQFIQAVYQNAVVLVGGFSSHIAHDKQIFRVLRDPQTLEFLTPEENAFVERHVPYTTFLDDRCVNLNEIKARKNSWVIKPCDHYGADEVHLGIEEPGSQWGKLVDRFANKRTGCAFVAQKFQRPFRTPTISLSDAVSAAQMGQEAHLRSYANLLGLYVYDGEFKGVFSRLGPNHIVTGLAGGLTAATLWVDCERP